jgi:hypothetical protein
VELVNELGTTELYQKELYGLKEFRRSITVVVLNGSAGGGSDRSKRFSSQNGIAALFDVVAALLTTDV